MPVGPVPGLGLGTAGPPGRGEGRVGRRGGERVRDGNWAREGVGDPPLLGEEGTRGMGVEVALVRSDVNRGGR